MLDTSFKEIISIIETRRNNAIRKVNEELIGLYWDFGKYISLKVKNEKWGSKTIDKLVEFMKTNYPNMKGFNRSNIYRMVQFYETYKDNEIVAPLARQLTWTNNVIILGATKSIEEKEFYMRLCIENNYKKEELIRQIKSGYYERYMLSNNKLNDELELNNNLSTKFLDIYSLEFLKLPNNYKEIDLKQEIINNMKSFILEIGKDFIFIDSEYKIKVGNKTFSIDLLFYNRTLKCMIALELKIGEFKSEYISKMNLYLEALDKEKKSDENPSIGIILCTSKDKEIVEYTMNKNLSKSLVSEYKLKLIDKRLLENKLKELKQLI